MQTSAIPYRVADFLKQHPPFQFIDEADLVALSRHGRVKFHEPDEYICWQSSAHTDFIYVIQQGSVALWDETGNPVLSDIRGAGDSIGIERFNGAATHLYSAKAASEVVLYALEASEFEALLARYPRAAQYVAAYSAVTADYAAPGERRQAHEVFLADLVRDRSVLQCPASTSIQQAARLLSELGAPALALVEPVGETPVEKMTAILTPSDIVRWVASGAVNPEQSVVQIAKDSLCNGVLTLPPQTLVSDCVLAMAEAEVSAAALTGDGSANTAPQSLITTASLAPVFGDQPLAILQEIVSAPRIESLRGLNERARAWMLDNLGVPSGLDWLAAFADLVNRRIVRRLLQLTEVDLSNQLLCFYGNAGRRELLTAMAPRIAVFGRQPMGLENAMTECGYLAMEPIEVAGFDEWKARFSRWIQDPIRNQIYQARPFFDLHPVVGTESLFTELEAHIQGELAKEPDFIRVLANDCLASFPPLTFFRDLVVEESGAESDTFRLGSSALHPLVDVARVFGLACGAPLGSSTRNRFEVARRRMPKHQAVFRDAAETMRVLLFHQARAGLRMRSSGSALPLAILSRQDRHVLKVGFRSIHRILEFTAPCDWLEVL